MDYHISELINLEQIQRWMERLLAIHGISLAILDPEAEILAWARRQDICMGFHRTYQASAERCRQSDLKVVQQLYDRPCMTYTCLNGVQGCAAPIQVEGHLLAAVFASQFFTGPPDEDYFRRQAREYGYDEDQYLQAVHQVPIISQEQVEFISEYVVELAAVLSAMAEDAVTRLDAVKMIKAQEERLSLVLEGSNLGFWDWNLGSGDLFLSPNWTQILGYAPEEVIHSIEDWKKLIHPEDQPRVMRILDAHLEGHNPAYETEYRVLAGDRTWKWIMARGKVVSRDESGQPLRAAGTLRDITARKEIEEAVRAERNFTSAVLDTAGDLIVVYDRQGRVVRFNRTCERVTGYKFAEVKSQYAWEVACAPEEAEKIQAFFRNLQRGQRLPEVSERFESCWLARNGRRHLINWTLSYLLDHRGAVSHVICTGTDVTRSRLMEERQRETTRELRSILENANAVIYALSFDGVFLFVSPTWTTLLGHQVVRVDGQPLTGFVYPADAAGYLDMLQRAQNTGRVPQNFEYRIRHRNGKWCWHAASGSLVTDKSGHPQYFVAVATDITEQKRAEKALKRSEERYRSLIMHIPGAVHRCQYDSNWTVDYISKFIEDIVGYPAADFVGNHVRSFQSVIHPQDRALVKERIDSGIRTRKPYTIEYRLLHADGSIRWVNSRGQAVLGGYGTIRWLDGVITDVTSRKQAEVRQQQLMQELENVNQELRDFAYIVSHDLKAPLRGIRSLAQWIYEDHYRQFDEEGKEQLDLLVNRVNRMQNLLDGILRYSRVGTAKSEEVPVDLNQVVKEVIQMLSVPSDITIMVEDEMPTLNLDRTRMQQVFENLIGNAIKHMDKSPGEIHIGCQDRGNCWQFSVGDNGPGIEEKYFERIFTIFQTLKPRDEFESTGVGLTIVKKIIDIYGGEIWVESQVGQGSTFYFTLPQLSGEGKGEKYAQH